MNSPRPLLCFVDAGGAHGSLDFAVEAVAAVAAAGGQAVSLLTSSGRVWPESATWRLRAAGATDAYALREAGLASAAVGILQALPLRAVAVGVGWPLASAVEGLLVIQVGASGAGIRRRPIAGVDLDTTAECIGVARQLGAWLARCLDA